MTENKIIDKIKKLLALASSPNEAEAKAAMNKAQELMAEYCIAEHKLYPNQEFGPQIVQTELYSPPFNPSRGLQKTLPYIAHAIAPIFGCHILVKFNKPLIYGFQTNIELLKYGLDTILNQAIVEYRNGYKMARTITFDESFWDAFQITLQNRFKENQAHEEGIVIYDLVRNKVKEVAKGFHTNVSGTNSHAGTLAGQLSGDSVNLVNGIKSGNMGGLLK